MDHELPSFRKPPVIETALSVQFKPFDGFSNAHLGLFWSGLRREFPKVADAEPILPQIELFGDQVVRRPRLPTFRVVVAEGAARLQMMAENEQTMVQLQNGRLAYNWRRLTDGEYPRWKVVLPQFESVLSQLQQFLLTEDLGEIEPNQWEVTYVNHLVRGRDWDQPTDWPALVPGLIGTAGRAPVGTAESVGCNWRFAMPEDSGRLHVDLFHGFAGSEPQPQEVLVLQLTSRGGIDVDAGMNLSAGLANGRRAIVRTFCDVTGPAAQQIWEREQ